MRLPPEDVDAAASLILQNGGRALAGRSVFITGGTGFLGRWLVEAFCALNEIGNLGARMFVLTRNATRFASAPGLTVVEGSVSDLARSAVSHCDFVIHGATETSAALATGPPRLFLETIDGVRHTLDFAVRTGAKRFLYLSSGAVYGRQPTDLSHIPEEFPGAPDMNDLQSVYAETKRAGELLCAMNGQRSGLETIIARGFAFLGPNIPLDRGFAAGNFIGDVLNGATIVVKGDGTPVRSYLYAADFAVWTWLLLLGGVAGRAYNVGSEVEVSIAELARETARLTEPAARVEILGTSDPTARPARYVPSTARAREELGLRETIDWRSALRKTYQWYAAQRVALESVR